MKTKKLLCVINALILPTLAQGFDIDKSKWTFVVGEGFDDETPITDARLFKEMVEDLEVPIVRRVCPTCSDSHKDTYYRRLTAMPDDFDLLDTLMDNWFDTDNNHNVDFAIYSSYLDAFSDVNRWKFCNFNDPGIGFPRDCGPVNKVNNNWNSYYRGGANAHYHAFLLPANPSFESKLQNLALGRRAIQSSQQSGGGPERAVDGNTVGIWRWNTVTHTRNEENPHWQVDLAHDSTIDTVYIWNRLDCCRDRLSNIRIDVYDYMHGDVVATRNIDGQGKVMNAVDFGGVEGSAIRITRESEPGQTQVMSLAEVQVQGTLGDPITPAPTSPPTPAPTRDPDSASLGNVALSKPASQSTTGWGGVASRGVDGGTNGNWSGRSMTHTQNDRPNPWWQVNLESSYSIERITVFGRLDCCTARLKDFKVTILNAGTEVWSYTHDGRPGYETDISVFNTDGSPVVGDVVKVSLDGDRRTLTLAEVQVWSSSA